MTTAVQIEGRTTLALELPDGGTTTLALAGNCRTVIEVAGGPPGPPGADAGGPGSGAPIDDSSLSLTRTWSASKISSELGMKQDAGAPIDGGNF